MGLAIYEYEELLLGNTNSFSNQNFSSDLQAQKSAKAILKFAIEKLLRWSPEEMAHRFNQEIIDKMKLKDILPYIPFPVELSRDTDFYYYAYYLYPKQITFDIKQSVIYTYRKILATYLLKDREDKYNAIKNQILKEKLKQDSGYQKIVDKGNELYKFPKEYLNETEGHVRAGICLQYAIKEFFSFKDIVDLYVLFADKKEALNRLDEYKLSSACTDLYASPLDFLHHSLPVSQKDDLLYSYLRYIQSVD